MFLRIVASSLIGGSLFASWSALGPAKPAAPLEKADPTWKKHAINDQSPFEAAAAADFNGDGKLDIFCGDSWYEAPKWTRHKVRDVAASPNPHYYEDFADSPLDCNGDGRPDIVTCNYFGKYIGWAENPGEGRDLRLTDTTSSSVLTGTVKRPRRGATPQNGTTTLQAISGLGATQNRLTNPPFAISAISARVVDSLLETGELSRSI